MMRFVLDTSVCMRWLLPTEKAKDQNYAASVLTSLNNNSALVPNLWHLEVANVLLNAVSKSDLENSLAKTFMQKLQLLPISTDNTTNIHAFGDTYNLATQYKLSSYDAAYLELAARHSIPLATLDKNLIKACKTHGVALYHT